MKKLMASFEECWWLVGRFWWWKRWLADSSCILGKVFWYFGPGLIFLDHIFRIFCILGPIGPMA